MFIELTQAGKSVAGVHNAKISVNSSTITYVDGGDGGSKIYFTGDRYVDVTNTYEDVMRKLEEAQRKYLAM